MFPTTERREEARRIRMCVTIVKGRDIGRISAKMIKRKGGGVGAGTGRGGAAAGGVIGKKGGGVKAAVRVRAVVQILRVLVVKGIISIIEK
jgi:hypothetical protein